MGGQRHAPATLHQGKRAGIQCTGGGIGFGVLLGVTRQPRFHGVRTPDRVARSEFMRTDIT